MPIPMLDHEVHVDVDLVTELVASQMPAWADLPVTIVEPWGTDNAIWRLGDDLVVRLPRIATAVEQVAWEAEWLPVIAPHLDTAVPAPAAVGAPGFGYPFPWAVHHWVPGRGASLDLMGDPMRFATDLARTVAQLTALPTTDLRPARNRARPLQEYDIGTRRAVESARDLIDPEAAIDIWEQALAAPPHAGPPQFVHGDLEGNCILVDGHLHGLIDWGSACAGDPAVDIQVAWAPLFTDSSRQMFLSDLDVDDATIARARGAAINQACAALPYYMHTYPLIVERSWHKLNALGVPTKR